jgi:cell division protease FtsH
VDTGLSDARQILTAHAADLERLAQGLLEYETLSGDEIRNLIAGKPPVRDNPEETASTKASAVPLTKKPRRPSGEPDAGGLEPQPS